MSNIGRKGRKDGSKILLSILVASLMLMPLLLDNEVKANEKIEENSQLNSKYNSGWIKHFEGTSWGHTLIQTSDGGYLVAGGTGYNDGSDALLLKTDSEGNQEWEKKFGSSMGWDAFEGLCETDDGGFIASGTASGKSFLVKTDANGNTIWQKNYGGTYSIDVRQTLDTGFIMAGSYSSETSQAILIKTDNEGNEIWNKTYGGNTFHSVRQTIDGGYIMSGWKTPPEGLFDDGWVVKTDESGNVQWEKTYESGDFFHSGMQTSDGGYIFTGGKSNLKKLNLCQLCLVKTDSEGNELWNHEFGTPFFTEMSLWIEETTDGGFIIIGHYLGIGLIINYIQTGHFMPLKNQMWLIKTDSQGNLEWDKKVVAGFGRCVKQTTDGGYILVGQKGSYNYPEGIYLIKTDENGNTV